MRCSRRVHGGLVLPLVDPRRGIGPARGEAARQALCTRAPTPSLRSSSYVALRRSWRMSSRAAGVFAWIVSVVYGVLDEYPSELCSRKGPVPRRHRCGCLGAAVAIGLLTLVAGRNGRGADLVQGADGGHERPGSSQLGGGCSPPKSAGDRSPRAQASALGPPFSFSSCRSWDGSAFLSG